ncbi:MAG TPA: hypothetical protein VJK28_00680 [Nitrospiria bacterium]|nr:hypothetical protein [Nitrospiria bacterium]
MEIHPTGLPLRGHCVSFMIGKTDRVLEAPQAITSRPLKSLPDYPGVMPKQGLIREQTERILDREVDLVVKAVPPGIVIVEGSFPFFDLENDPLLEVSHEVLLVCRRILSEFGCHSEFDEEYTVYCISDYQGDPEVFLTLHGDRIAALLKDERMALDEEEIRATLQVNLKYSKDDLTIVDWDGAFLFDPKGDFASNIELFQTANLQLLRSRILDNLLDSRLQQMVHLLRRTRERRLLRSGELRKVLREIIEIRTTSLLESEAVDQNIKLIGDWYSARLYGLISKKLHLEDWNRNITEKLDVLEDVYTMATENFSMSATQTLEFILIGGWFLLQLGWFTLLFLELFYLK